MTARDDAPSTPSPSTLPLDPRLASALAHVMEAPTDGSAWDAAEALAGELNRPDEVAALYRKAIADGLPREAIHRIAERAVRFHEEWAEDAKHVEAVLTHVLDATRTADGDAAEARWAFDRLVLAHTGASRWSEVLALYDRALTASEERLEPTRRAQLLDEASHVAKDFADDPERAIGYLRQLVRLRPSDARLSTMLERLLEKQGRHRDLVDLWITRLPTLATEARMAARARIATTLLDKLDAPPEALTQAEALLAEDAAEVSTCAILERIASTATAPVDTRARALRAAKARWTTSGDAQAIVRTLRASLALPDDGGLSDRIELHRELVTRLLDLDDPRAAMDAAGAWLLAAPDDTEARERMRTLAGTLSAPSAYAGALVASANAADGAQASEHAVELLVEAARVHAEVLTDPKAAISLLQRALGFRTGSAHIQLAAARSLTALLEGTDRAQEQIDALDRRAALEPGLEDRRAVLAELATASLARGDAESALATWERRLALVPPATRDSADPQARDARVSLLERMERWPELIEALTARAATLTDSVALRADRQAIATVYERRLARPEDALETWRTMAADGRDEAARDAVVRLLHALGRHEQAVTLLRSAAEAETDPDQRAVLLAQIATVQATQLGDLSGAIATLASVLELKPRAASARDALVAILPAADRAQAAAATEALSKAYRATDDWAATLSLLPARLACADAGVEAAALLLEASDLAETRAHDPMGALALACRAFAIAPAARTKAGALSDHVYALAEKTGKWDPVVAAYRSAIALPDAPQATTLDLQFRLGAILEQRVLDEAAALDAYAPVFEASPGRDEVAEAVIRVAAQRGRWNVVADAVVGSARARGRLELPIVNAFENATEMAAFDRSAWVAATEALDVALKEPLDVPAALHRTLLTQLSIWYRDRRADADAAQRTLERAVAFDATDADTLRMLAVLQRRAPGRPLLATLLKLADASADDLGVLYEAAGVALDSLGDSALAIPILRRLLDAAGGRWTTPNSLPTLPPPSAPTRAAGDVQVALSAESFSAWALEKLASLYIAAANHAAAAALLTEGASLPFRAVLKRRLRLRAAAIVDADLHDPERAIELYRETLAETADDAETLAALAALFDREKRYDALIALRRSELQQTTDDAHASALRLDLSRALGLTGDVEGQIETLQANLEQAPGDGATIAELGRIYAAAGRSRELANVLHEQALRLETLGEALRAAALWQQVGTLSDAQLADVDRAIESLRRAASLRLPYPEDRSDENLATLDALARLHGARGEHALAIEWLDKRIARTAVGARSDSFVRLADHHARVGHEARAIEVLRSALEETPAGRAPRDLLATLLRGAHDDAALAEVLREGASHATDPQEQLRYLREAAELFAVRLGRADDAIPLLRQAIELAPTDRPVRLALADALRVTGRDDEAKALLDAMVEEFGRRRPHERAGVHVRLAELADQRGALPEALAHLDLASAIDVGNVGALKMLGSLARRTGELERAERALRALLVIARRAPTTFSAFGPQGRFDSHVGPSEVLFELHRIAVAMGQRERAEEMLETAFEAAAENEDESRRLANALRTAGEPALLLRALQARLASAHDPAIAGETHVELAALYESTGRDDEAFAAILEALTQAPGNETLQAQAYVLAKRIGHVARFVERLQAVARAVSSSGDANLEAMLHLRIGRALEDDLRDLAGAANAYEAAEQTSAVDVEAWAALDRVYRALGDEAGEARVLGRRLEGDALDHDPLAKTDASYRLATLLLADPKRRGEGVAVLSGAIDRELRTEVAAALLRSAAAKPSADDSDETRSALAALFENVARTTTDRPLLLEALIHATALPAATTESLKEAVELAQQLDDRPATERLLARAIELAEQRDQRPEEATWAQVALAGMRKDAGDLRGAVELLRRAAAFGEPIDSSPLLLDAAALAIGPLDDAKLAASLYEELRARDPADRTAWGPLLEIYRLIGEREKLEALIAATVEVVFDGTERVALRLERARLLLDTTGREDEAIQTLNEVLYEDPEHQEAMTMLAGVLDRLGRAEELVDLLSRQLDTARGKLELSIVEAVSLQLAALMKVDRRTDALDVLRASAAVHPQSKPILSALVALQADDDDLGDRADALEQLLAVESGSAAGALAERLAALRETQGDAEAAVRALDLGYRRNPENRALLTRLEAIYRAHDRSAELAALIEVDGTARGAAGDVTQAVARLREAAELHSTTLADPASAARVLSIARGLAPTDLGVLRALLDRLAEANDAAGASAEIDRVVLERRLAPGAQAELLQRRSKLRSATGDDSGAIADLEQAYTLVGPIVAQPLADALERRRKHAIEIRNVEAERIATLRLIDVLHVLDPAAAHERLQDWVARSPRDRAALRLLADFETAANNADAVIAIYGRLVALEEGDAQVTIALKLANACEAAGRAGDARDGLELALRNNTSNEPLRAQLRRLYQEIGAFTELAQLALIDAENADDDAKRYEHLVRAGQLYLASAEDGGAAIVPLEAALQIQPANHDATVLLADAYVAGGEIERAVALLQPAIALHKGKRTREVGQLQHRMARAARAGGGRDVELAWLSRALDCDMQNGEVAAELADVAMALHQWDVAMKALKIVTLLKTPGPMSRSQATLRQGMIAYYQGDPKKAVFLAKKALSEEPNLHEASDFLRQLGAQ